MKNKISSGPISEELWLLLSQAFYGFPAQLDIIPRPSLAHQSNRLYDFLFKGRHYIVKEYLKPEEFAESPIREYKGLQILGPTGIAPRPVYFNPGSPHTNRPIVVYELMEGQMWDRTKPMAEDLRRLFGLYATINSVAHHQPWPSRSDGYPFQARDRLERTADSYLSYCESEFPEGQPAAEKIKQLFHERSADLDELKDLEPVKCFSRGDPRFANIIEKPDGSLGMVDWEDCGWLDPALDMADLVTHPNQEDLLDWSEWIEFLDPYARTREEAGDGSFERRLEIYTGVLFHYRLLMLLEIGMDQRADDQFADWQINTMPANQRLGRYLAKSSAWPEIEPHEPLVPASDIRFFAGL
ncbi:MAG: aminoglycoside phosphotransferase family protein [Anaerolineales bacterium]|nr:aminoglycoside phosphotransferase family protein [Anaerolineales bacterium]